ncbi:MAG TPA: YceI family protein [Paracoccaceae bacterium]|nr:YceI family protein [Paracoccaceae bacterium]
MRTALLIGLLFACGPASAGLFKLDPSESKISFVYLENGEPKTGHFARLDGRAEFDPNQLAAADVRLTIQSAGVDLGDPIRSHFAQSIDWFDAERHPSFTVTLRRLERLGAGRYRAEAVVTIKGHEVGITPELALEEAGGRLRATGELVLNRHDYRLGVGFSSLFTTVATDVLVKFDLSGVPAN